VKASRASISRIVLIVLSGSCSDQTGPLPLCSLRVVERSAVDPSFEFLGMDPPIYPDSARDKGHQGTAIVRVIVDHDGSLCEAKVSSSSGDDDLDSAALVAARTAMFSPARQEGAPVRVEVLVPVEFSLRPGG